MKMKWHFVGKKIKLRRAKKMPEKKTMGNAKKNAKELAKSQ